MITHFNFVNIVIYPLEKQLYRIQIFNKIDIEFGPLKDGMVVSWNILPYLIRTTAINANKELKHHKHPNYDKQSILRYKAIKDIVKSHSSIQSNRKSFQSTRS